jgi:hypothetical protein
MMETAHHYELRVDFLLIILDHFLITSLALDERNTPRILSRLAQLQALAWARAQICSARRWGNRAKDKRCQRMPTAENYVYMIFGQG